MDENTQQKVALFRYALIAPILNETHSQATAKEYMVSVCGKTYDVPYCGKREFSSELIKKDLRLKLNIIIARMIKTEG